jgi:hypothetical protein
MSVCKHDYSYYSIKDAENLSFTAKSNKKVKR